MMSILSLLLLSLSASAEESISEWVNSVPATAATLSLLTTLPSDDGPVPAELPAALAAHSRQRLAQRAQSKIESALMQCKVETEAGFVNENMPVQNQISEYVLESTVQIESVFCLDSGTAAEAFEIYRSEAFQIAALPLVTQLRRDGDQMCIQTKPAMGGLLPPASFCHRFQAHTGPDFSGVVGWLTSNRPGPDHQALFFRYYVVVFVDRPDGGVAGFRAAVTRGRDLNTLQRGLIRATADKRHSYLQEHLNTALNAL